MSDTESKFSRPKRLGPNGAYLHSKNRTPVDDAIDRLEEEDWGDLSSTVNVTVEVPKHSKIPAPLRALKLLPPWGRVVVLLAILGAAVAGGLAGKLLSAIVGP